MRRNRRRAYSAAITKSAASKSSGMSMVGESCSAARVSGMRVRAVRKRRTMWSRAVPTGSVVVGLTSDSAITARSTTLSASCCFTQDAACLRVACGRAARIVFASRWQPTVARTHRRTSMDMTVGDRAVRGTRSMPEMRSRTHVRPRKAAPNLAINPLGLLAAARAQLLGHTHTLLACATMASPFGNHGPPGRCYYRWQAVETCAETPGAPKELCRMLLEDYMECLHSRKSVRRAAAQRAQLAAVANGCSQSNVRSFARCMPWPWSDDSKRRAAMITTMVARERRQRQRIDAGRWCGVICIICTAGCLLSRQQAADAVCM